jgi:hypothetical protein
MRKTVYVKRDQTLQCLLYELRKWLIWTLMVTMSRNVSPHLRLCRCILVLAFILMIVMSWYFIFTGNRFKLLEGVVRIGNSIRSWENGEPINNRKHVVCQSKSDDQPLCQQLSIEERHTQRNGLLTRFISLIWTSQIITENYDDTMAYYYYYYYWLSCYAFPQRILLSV